MSTINRYINNQHAYIAEKKKQPLLGFTTPSGTKASWEDIALTFTDENNISINFLFNNDSQPNARFKSTFSDKDRLGLDTHHLLFAFALDVVGENVSIKRKAKKVTAAKKFLIALNENVASTSMDKIQKTIDSMRYIDGLTTFFEWLKLHKMLPASVSPNLMRSDNATRHKSGDDAIEAENSKLPDEKALLALGAIFYDIIPKYPDNNNNVPPDSWAALTHSTLSQLDSYVCTMSALAMSSPNRIAAEQVLLTKQRIHTHTQVVDRKEATVHYLNWRGSKGYKDYQNHINAEMAESLDRALHYTALATEPARMLARFYQNPYLSLKKLLDDFEPSPKNLNVLKPKMNKPTNLIHLGFLLGFYDDKDGYVRVTADTKGAIDATKNKGFPTFIKHISKLLPLDKLEIKSRCPYASSLVGARVGTKKQVDKYFNSQTIMTVEEFQNHYIKINQRALSGLNRAKSKHVDYEQALFTYTEKQLSSQQASHFLLVPIESLCTYFERNIKKGNKDHTVIFERHGFSAEFAIKPHQFRHWQNNYLASKGLPHILITMLSGRKTPEQTLTYIHTTDAQNASIVGDILYEKENEEEVQGKVSKRLQSKAQYDDATSNLSPTFVSEVGFCAQDLTISPCTYMTEFETQCTLCSSSCHIAHDEYAIELLQKDLAVQNHNLKRVVEAINFATSKGMQQWYEMHYQNTCMLKSLIEVLSDNSIKEGAIVRFLTRSNTVRITDLETKTVAERKLSLPDAKKALQNALTATKALSKDVSKDNLLDFLGSV
ncbi:hypothetical protein [uncultured Vibrio sp.]|uniref:hypothetical protein n=1 Tax=uncultured Vibrio sp. TaxID=114054 RepID=UPI002612F269|nr:hypothetical protein [uncultured Vibrio sp.]